MKLVLYSGGDHQQNEELDFELLELIGKGRPSATFIPASSLDAEYGFDEFIDYFKKYDFDDFMMFPIDVPFTKYQAKKALDRDLLFLSGGNTFYFLKHLKKSGFAVLLKEYVAQGGIVVGTSAGSILLTPDILMASYPEFDRDENEVNIKNLKSLGLVNFEFFPHYKNTKRYIHAMNLISRKISRPLYAVSDGSGIVVNDGKISFVGDIWMFCRGKKFLIHYSE